MCVLTGSLCLSKEVRIQNSKRKFLKYEALPESKDTSRVGRYGNFYAYYGNTAVDLYPLPVSQNPLTVVEPTLFE